MTENENREEPKKKKLSCWKIAILISLLLLALLTIKIILILTAKPTISVNYIVQWNKISKPQNYDPNQNAAFDYKKAQALLPVSWREIAPFRKKQWLSDINDTELYKLKKYIEQSREAMVIAERATEKADFWLRQQGGDFARPRNIPAVHLSKVVNLADLLTWRARLHAAEGNSKAAFRDVMTILGIGCHVTQRKTTVIQFKAIGIRQRAIRAAFLILANTHPDTKSLQQFHQDFRTIVSHNPTLPDFGHERLWTLDSVQRIFTDNGRGNGHLIATKLSRQHVANVNYFLNPQTHHHRKTSKLWDELYEILGTEPPEPNIDLALHSKVVSIGLFGPYRKNTLGVVEDYFNQVNGLKALTPSQLHLRNISLKELLRDIQKECPFLLPTYNVHRLKNAHHANRVCESALLTVIAALRYKSDKGKLPQTLDELVSTDYLKELPMDTYSNKPLVYKQTDSDFTLYGVGKDFTDNGGIFGNWRNEGNDMVFWPMEKSVYRRE